MKWRPSVLFLVAFAVPGLAWGIDPLDALVATCRGTHFCHAMATVPTGTSGEDLTRLNLCFRDKVRACFYATAMAAAREGKRSSMLTRSILYGNFCGWRSLARKADGNFPNWDDREEVRTAIARTPALDVVDEECKRHDLKYDEPPYDICKADTELTENLARLSWDQNVDLSPAAREVALAFSETIHRNRFTCGAIGAIRHSGH